ncbi:cupin domain-containing protein [Haloarcula sp. CBA1127]|uniref:cupin domain-containing protein n=1 Tax=Haloarcula sp. CBA1127 TaxID=1765055 RepID=UPI00073E7DD6|nr:cupin domain-containing protein [Haloarcula sp. CBA1127]
MPSQITGRPLSDAGKPTAGPALEIDPEGRAMGLFSDSPHALASSPGMGMWSTILQYPESGADGTPAMLVWLSPEATTLPAHVHTSSTETFRPVEGELTVVVDDTPQHLATGEELTVEPGDPHYFRNDTDDFVAFRVEVPWTKTIDTQYMVAGLDHEGYLGADGEYGEPGFVQGLLLAEYVNDETRIAVAPQIVQRLLWASVGRIARLTGRSAMDERYLRDRFWESNVEQPDI